MKKGKLVLYLMVNTYFYFHNAYGWRLCHHAIEIKHKRIPDFFDFKTYTDMHSQVVPYFVL